MENILIFGLIFLGFLNLYQFIFKTGSNASNGEQLDIEWHENYIDELNQQISAKSRQLTTLEKQIEDRTIDKSVSLTKLEIQVLDYFDESGIRIPSDIIEDLHSMRFTTEFEIFKYIQNQRTFWKLENTKKPFREVKK
jgi:Bacteriophage phi-29 early protein GP16.7